MEKNLALKIKKLMNLAGGTDFPEESASALAKAQALMIEHGISEAMVNVADEVPDEPIQEFRSAINEEDEGKSKTAKWKRYLVYYLAKHNGCMSLAYGTQIRIVGRASDCDKIRYLYSYCVNEIDRLTKAQCKGEGRNYATNFRLGCVEAIQNALKAELEALRSKYTCNCKALLVIDKSALRVRETNAWVDKNMRLGKARSWQGSAGNSEARAHGRQAGSNVYSGTRAQVGGETKKLS